MAIRNNGENSFVKVTNERLFWEQKKIIDGLIASLEEKGQKVFTLEGKLRRSILVAEWEKIRMYFPDNVETRDLPDNAKIKLLHFSNSYEEYLAELPANKFSPESKAKQSKLEVVENSQIATKQDILDSEERLKQWLREGLTKKAFKESVNGN